MRQVFAHNVRAERTRMRLSQSDVLEQTGITQPHIAEIETGEANIRIETMVKLAAVLKTPLWKLLKP